MEFQTHVLNSAILKFRIFSGRCHFRLWVFASLVNPFTIDTDEYCPRCYKINDAKNLKYQVVSFYTLCSQVIRTLQIGSFNWGL